MSRTTITKWKLWGLHFPLFIVLCPFIFLFHGVWALIGTWCAHWDDELRWAEYVDNYKSKHPEASPKELGL